MGRQTRPGMQTFWEVTQALRPAARGPAEGSGRAPTWSGPDPCPAPQALPPSGIHIFASQLHTHLTGRKVVTVLARAGRERTIVNRDNHYSPHFQARTLPPRRACLTLSANSHRNTPSQVPCPGPGPPLGISSKGGTRGGFRRVARGRIWGTQQPSRNTCPGTHLLF